MSSPAYARAGVSLEAARRTRERLAAAVRSTHGDGVLDGFGGFGGLFQLGPQVLVATTDGVGTKAGLAARLGRLRGLGHDLVNHCLNDLLCQGACPLFLLDYLGFGRLDPHAAVEIVEGLAEACRAAGVALLGGETAEMPDTYLPGALDVVGTLVGVVRPSERLGPHRVREGDLLVGLPSSGLHTNGFSLVRSAVEGLELEAVRPELGCSLAEELLRPHRSYLGRIPSGAHALAHITGGGLVGNLPRMVPPGLSARIHLDRWTVPPIFRLIQELGGVGEQEMVQVFNMGLGMVAAVPPSPPPEGLIVGEVVTGQEPVVLVGLG